MEVSTERTLHQERNEGDPLCNVGWIPVFVGQKEKKKKKDKDKEEGGGRGI